MLDTLDYSKCTGFDCPIKEKCWRYVKPSSRFQSWLNPDPEGSVSCMLYIPMEKDSD